MGAFDFLTPDTPAIAVDTEITAGDKNQAAEVQIGDRQHAEIINVIQDIPVWVMLALMLMSGWAIPSPGAMWRGFLKILPWSKS